MTYDVQRYALAWNRDDGSHFRPANYGSYVIASEAEAHERAAVEQAIRDCIAAVRKEFAMSNEPPYVEEVVDALRVLLEKP